MTVGVESFQDHAAWLQSLTVDASRHADENAEIAILRSHLTAQGMLGTCAICDGEQRFVCREFERGQAMSLRESLICERCGGNARQRATARALFDSVAIADSRVYLTEQASRFYLQLSRRAGCVLGSEFFHSWRQRLRLSLWLWRHGSPQGLRHEDVTRLSFAAGSFDAVGSLDVLEHISDYRRALREFARILRPGGALVLTVPFYIDLELSRELARIDAHGAIEHLHAPEFHGDPVRRGVLCFHHFGWDLLQELREAGFASAEAIRLRDPAQGWPEAQWVIRARR